MAERLFTSRIAAVGFLFSLLFAGLGYGFHSTGMALGILAGGTLGVLNFQGLGLILGWAFQPGMPESEDPKGLAGLVFVSFFVRYGLGVVLLGTLVFFRWVDTLGIVIGLSSALFALGAVLIKSFDLWSGKTAV